MPRKKNKFKHNIEVKERLINEVEQIELSYYETNFVESTLEDRIALFGKILSLHERLAKAYPLIEAIYESEPKQVTRLNYDVIKKYLNSVACSSKIE